MVRPRTRRRGLRRAVTPHAEGQVDMGSGKDALVEGPVLEVGGYHTGRAPACPGDGATLRGSAAAERSPLPARLPDSPWATTARYRGRSCSQGQPGSTKSYTWH